MNTPRAIFRPATVSGYVTGVLDLNVAGRRVLSVPSQLGCTIGCTFCVSQTRPLVRNLQASEMLTLIDQCFAAESARGRSVEVSFTGEGEPLLNWKQTELVVEALARQGVVDGVRYCLSGLAAARILPELDTGLLPTRLQVSLHAARQSVRDKLVPKSVPLVDLEKTLLAQADGFASVELNVVLQDGINDSEADVDALAQWGCPSWPILLNPLLTSNIATVASRTGFIAGELRRRGREVKVYRTLAEEIVRGGIYPRMTAKPVHVVRQVAHGKAQELDLASTAS